jgi:hypothetical protein
MATYTGPPPISPASRRLLYHANNFAGRPELLREFIIKGNWSAARQACESFISVRYLESIKLEDLLEQLKILEEEG